MNNKIKIGFAPTRRSIFSAPDAIKYANLTRAKLDELGVEYVDITDINDEGLLYDENDRLRMVEKFRAAKVDGLFVPHTNFGTEYEVARLAKDLNVPVLLWGPRDERPDENGVRLRDSQCGLFATGKVLRRFQVPFTYMTNCRLDDEEFERGIRLFIAVCRTVRTFRSTRILQIAPRPYDFWSTMCNEGELLEKFNIQLAPIPMTELIQAVKSAKAEGKSVRETVDYCRSCMDIAISDEQLENVAALKVGMKALAAKYHCNAIAIQCWNALQDELGIMPCAANSLLNEESIPTVCETDIHGAITALLVEAASRENKRSFFADWTVRHPDNENGELLQHCGPWPMRSPPSATRSLSLTPALSRPRRRRGLSLSPASTATTANTRCCSATPRASTARTPRAPTSGSRSKTSSVWKQSSWRGRTSTTASASTRTSCRCCTRRASTSA